MCLAAPSLHYITGVDSARLQILPVCIRFKGKATPKLAVVVYACVLYKANDI